MTATVNEISKPQLRRLQVLYGQYAHHSLDAAPTREGRIAWASSRIGRPIDSFSDLTLDEGKKLIDGLQAALGVKLPSKTPRRRWNRRDGQKAGTEGRHDQAHEETTLVGDRDIRRIQREMNRLGWDQARLDAFLASPRGPNGRSALIRTLGEANRVYWALKHMKINKQNPHDSSQEQHIAC
jgi:hypothetical protein